MDVLLFGDQTGDYLFTFQKLLHSYQGPLLSDFLGKVNAVLHYEIAKISKDERAEIPIFSTIEELVSRYKDSFDLNAMLDSTLACLTQLAHFIRSVTKFV